MMKNIQYMPRLPFAVTALSLMLSACGGGSNNIATTPGGSSGGSSTCTAANCYEVVFDDTPVANLNFECGIYYGTTGNTGAMRCPADSTVKFFVKASNGTRRVNLGSFVVKPVRAIHPSEKLDTSLIRVTVKDLAENISGVPPINSLDDEAAKTAINLSRFIQSIGLKSEPYIASAPVNRISIDKDLVNGTPAKAATSTSAAVAAIPGLDMLSKDIEPADFKDGSFATKLQPWLAAHKRTLISEAEAKARLEKNFKAIKSGFYYGLPSQRLTIGNEGTENDLDLGISGKGTIDTAFEVTNTVFAMSTREGQTIGYGMQWASKKYKDEVGIFNLFRTTKFAKMRVISGGVDPYTSRFNDFKFQVSRANFKGANSTDYENVTDPAKSSAYENTFANGNIFSFLTGKLQRDLVIPGTAAAYKRYLQVDSVGDQSDLGSWEQKTAPTAGTGDLGNKVYEGRATISKIGGINTYLDPKVWRVKELVAKGQNYIFPLYATLTFKFSDAYYDACTKNPGTTPCEKSRSLNIVFQENGDIWTSNNSTATACVAPVREVPEKSSLVKDTMIGTVRAAFLSSDATQYYISPSILLSGPGFGSLDGMQVGTGQSERIKINVTGVRTAAAGSKGSLNATSAEAIVSGGAVVVEGEDNVNDALWYNLYNNYIFAYVAAINADEASKEPKYADERPLAQDLILAAQQPAGVLTVDTASCYKVERK